MVQLSQPYSSAFPHSLDGHSSYLNGIDHKGPHPYRADAFLQIISKNLSVRAEG